jgi:hypothetical protein
VVSLETLLFSLSFLSILVPWFVSFLFVLSAVER